jgi:ankyrin repeat protein
LPPLLPAAPRTTPHTTLCRQVAELLASGADANSASDDGETPLHVSGIKCNQETVDLLIKAGAKVNRQTVSESSLAM